MLTNILATLAENPQLQLALICSKQNERLMDWATSKSPRIELFPIEFSVRSLNNISPLFRIDRILRVARILRRVRPQKVIVVQGRIELGLAGLIASRLLGFYTISYIPMAHLLNSFSKERFAGLRDIINRYLYRLADRYVTISHSIAEDIRCLSKRPTHVLPNIVEQFPATSLSTSEARNALGLPLDGKLFCVMGRLEIGQKGQDIAIAALQLLINRGCSAKLLLVGDGSDLNYLTKMVETVGLQNDVFFKSWSPDVAQIYAASDLILIPSHFEGVPLVMLEALMAGKPIAATGVDGMRDYLPPEWLVHPLTAEELAHRISQILSDPFLGKKIDKARDFVATQTSPSTFKSTAYHLFVDQPAP